MPCWQQWLRGRGEGEEGVGWTGTGRAPETAAGSQSQLTATESSM